MNNTDLRTIEKKLDIILARQTAIENEIVNIKKHNGLLLDVNSPVPTHLTMEEIPTTNNLSNTVPNYNQASQTNPLQTHCSNPQNIVPNLPNNQPSVTNNQTIVKHKQKQSGIEENIGKNIMGILAAFLIFIGLASIVFALYEVVSDVVKVFGMLLISGIFVGAGFALEKRNKNSLSTTLLSIGVGSIYITLLAALIGFNLINNIVFFILFAIWITFTIFVQKRTNSFIFNLIGSVGVLVSTLLGVAGKLPHSEILLLTIFILVLNGLYQYINREEHIAVNLITNIISCISTACLTGLLADEFGIKLSLLGVISLLILFVYSLVICVFKYLKASKATKYTIENIMSIYMHFYFVIFALATFFKAMDMIDVEYFVYTVIFALFSGIFLFSKIKNINKSAYYSLLTYGMFNTFFFNILFSFESNIFTRYLGILWLSLPFLFLFMWKREKIFTHIMLWLTIGISIIRISADENIFSLWTHSLDTENIVYMIIFVLSTCLFIAIHRKDSLTKAIKTPILLINSVFIIALLNQVLFNVVGLAELKLIFEHELEHLFFKGFTLIPLSLLFTIMLYTPFYKDWSKNKEDTAIEKGNYIALKLINAGLLLSNIIMLRAYKHPLNLIYVLISSIQLFAKLKDYLDKKYSSWNGFYVGSKVTIYYLFVLPAIVPSELSFVISLFLLILSIITILYGFKRNYKSFRLYGLFLSLFSILKLIIVDLGAISTVFRVFGFIIAGLLCLVIVYAYNKMSERLFTKEEN